MKILLKPLPILFLFILAGMNSLYCSDTFETSLTYKEDGNTEVSKAVRAKDLLTVRQLIKSGCDVNKTNSDGITPLMIAIDKNASGIAHLLVRAGAYIEAYDDRGNTPFMYALQGTEKCEIVKLLLSSHANIEAINNKGLTPLMIAAICGHYNSMLLLLEHSPNLETPGGTLGRTALVHAIINNKYSTAKLLVDSGADIETRDFISWTPLMHAALQNNGGNINMLLVAGANSEAQTYEKSVVTTQEGNFIVFPVEHNVPIGSTSLDIAKQFNYRTAIFHLSK